MPAEQGHRREYALLRWSCWWLRLGDLDRMKMENAR